MGRTHPPSPRQPILAVEQFAVSHRWRSIARKHGASLPYGVHLAREPLPEHDGDLSRQPPTSQYPVHFRPKPSTQTQLLRPIASHACYPLPLKRTTFSHSSPSSRQFAPQSTPGRHHPICRTLLIATHTRATLPSMTNRHRQSTPTDAALSPHGRPVSFLPHFVTFLPNYVSPARQVVANNHRSQLGGETVCIRMRQFSAKFPKFTRRSALQPRGALGEMSPGSPTPAPAPAPQTTARAGSCYPTPWPAGRITPHGGHAWDFRTN